MLTLNLSCPIPRVRLRVKCLFMGASRGDVEPAFFATRGPNVVQMWSLFTLAPPSPMSSSSNSRSRSHVGSSVIGSSILLGLLQRGVTVRVPVTVPPIALLLCDNASALLSLVPSLLGVCR